MSILGDVAAGAVNPAAGIAGLVKDLLDRVLPDPALKAQAQAQAFELLANGDFAAKAQQQLALAQIDVNKAEAAAGGPHFRDGAGWVCVAGFAFTVLRPVVEWGLILAGHPVKLPEMDMTEIGPMLAGLLGLGGMHVVERVKGAS
jgi:hypothetical protein